MTADLASDDRTVRDILGRAASPEFDAWERQVQRTGGCSHPIRLHGHVLEGGQVVLDTAAQPDGVLLKACGNRRASVCPSCSYTYRGDTWQMLHAGIVGGKGVPDTVAAHPAAFVTLTAPSFGAVHGHRDNNRMCRPHAEGKLCPHGRPRWCRRRHGDDDTQLGQPLCGDCYDYQAHVLFNWWAPELWRRFTIQVRRSLAAQHGLSEQAFRRVARLSYAKVAEFQRRGVVHFHAIVRLDGPDPDDQTPPPPSVTFDHLDAAVRSAAGHVSYAAESDTQPVLLRFGSQIDVRPVNTGAGGDLTGEAVAAYISKYATKAAEDLGVGLIDGQPTPHVRRLLATGRALAESVPELERMERWDHMLFFRGHFSTKSRRYSVTLGSLRGARRTFQRRRAREARGLDPDVDDDTTLVVARLQYVGRGYTTTGDAVLAASIAARCREHRDLARDDAR